MRDTNRDSIAGVLTDLVNNPTSNTIDQSVTTILKVLGIQAMIDDCKKSQAAASEDMMKLNPVQGPDEAMRVIEAREHVKVLNSVIWQLKGMIDEQ